MYFRIFGYILVFYRESINQYLGDLVRFASFLCYKSIKVFQGLSRLFSDDLKSGTSKIGLGFGQKKGKVNNFQKKNTFHWLQKEYG